MALIGFCSNEQILKSALKKYESNPHNGFSPEMMFLEEFLHFVVENSIEYSVCEVVYLALENYDRLKKSERLRFEDLADEANIQVFGL
ncbi:hypothetical protein KR084_004723 [Drosophila pseudotakahashii]|nr:hypothetical protein KR084_004723 [Drosophila pseudotakahashii]